MPPLTDEAGHKMSTKERNRCTILIRMPESKEIFVGIMTLLANAELLFWADMRMTSYARFCVIVSLTSIGMCLYQQKHGLPPFAQRRNRGAIAAAQ